MMRQLRALLAHPLNRLTARQNFGASPDDFKPAARDPTADRRGTHRQNLPHREDWNDGFILQVDHETLKVSRTVEKGRGLPVRLRGHQPKRTMQRVNMSHAPFLK